MPLGHRATTTQRLLRPLHPAAPHLPPIVQLVEHHQRLLDALAGGQHKHRDLTLGAHEQLQRAMRQLERQPDDRRRAALQLLRLHRLRSRASGGRGPAAEGTATGRRHAAGRIAAEQLNAAVLVADGDALAVVGDGQRARTRRQSGGANARERAGVDGGGRQAGEVPAAELRLQRIRIVGRADGDEQRRLMRGGGRLRQRRQSGGGIWRRNAAAGRGRPVGELTVRDGAAAVRLERERRPVAVEDVHAAGRVADADALAAGGRRCDGGRLEGGGEAAAVGVGAQVEEGERAPLQSSWVVGVEGVSR